MAREPGHRARAMDASLGCGVPTAVADLREGETVLDLGSERRRGLPHQRWVRRQSGKAIGLDMTHEVLGVDRQHWPARRRAPSTSAT